MYIFLFNLNWFENQIQFHQFYFYYNRNGFDFFSFINMSFTFFDYFLQHTFTFKVFRYVWRVDCRMIIQILPRKLCSGLLIFFHHPTPTLYFLLHWCRRARSKKKKKIRIQLNDLRFAYKIDLSFFLVLFYFKEEFSVAVFLFSIFQTHSQLYIL